MRSDNCKIMIIDANLASINDMSDSPFIIDLVNSVDEFKSSSQHFILFQNYPNPFNPSTKIKYRIKNNSKVLLEIFNINGEKISTLVDSEQQIGIHEAIWYGKDDNDHSVTSGFYIYKIKVNNSVRAGKMVLIK
jgi:hypothetical protein